jgi:hypothetical protein
MKQIKKLSALVVSVVAVGLLLGAGTAMAAEFKYENGCIKKINRLKVSNRHGEIKKYDVKFKYDTAVNVYTDRGFDFSNEENAILALKDTRDALNNQSPIPKGASSVCNKQFFIGVEVEENVLVGGVGEEYIKNQERWKKCQTDCSAGAAFGKANEAYTWAIYTKSDDQ